MQPALEIRMVQENLSLAITLWAAVEKGLITTDHLPSGRTVVTSDAGRVLEVYSPLAVGTKQALVRCAANQVRGAFAISVMQTHQALAHLRHQSPLDEPDPDHQAARCAVYLLNSAFAQGLLRPTWACPPGYQRRFEVRPISFTLDATALNGRPVSWDDFGGLKKYLDLLEYCIHLVEEGPQPRLVDKDAADAARLDGEGPDPTLEDEEGLDTYPPGEEGLETVSLGSLDEADGPDPVAGFVAARCLADPLAKTIARDLYSAYLDWCRETGHPALAQRSFGMRLTQLGFQRRRRGKGRHWWHGIGLSTAGP